MNTELYLTDSWQVTPDRRQYSYCTKLSIGHCVGCVAISQTANRFRWQRKSPEQAAGEIALAHCPPNLSPDLETVINKMASLGMGQRREENVVFDSVEPNPDGYKLHGRY